MRTYLKLMLALYFIALAISLACRILLKLFHIDISTGFYSGGDLYVLIFNICLAAVPVIMFASNRLKKADDDYPVNNPDRILNLLAVLAGASIILFAVMAKQEPRLEQGFSENFYMVRSYINIVMGTLSGLSLIYLGIGGVFGRKRPPAGIIIALPVVWQTVLLITQFNSYTTVTTISDHLLIVLFMIFNALFLMGQARTVCSQMRKDGRNYAIPSGLCASLCGILLVVPNYIYIAINQAPMPTPMLGYFESVYILIMSLYALAFVISLIRSIKRV